MKQVLQKLLKRAEDPRKNLLMFGAGTLMFFAGCGLLIWANQKIPDSLTQEWIALAGLAIAALGALIASVGYISLSLLRIIRFMQSDKPDTSETIKND